MSAIQNILIDKLGLQPFIAEFFVRRKLPGNNDYWLNRSNYVSLSTGYIFIPVFFDSLVKRGIPANEILGEDLLLTMERVLQSAGRMEYKKISGEEHIQDCRSLLLEANVSSAEVERAEAKLVHRPFRELPARFAALRRANTFLYTFGGSTFDFDIIFHTWEMVLPLLLMLDDFADLEEDILNGEENCLLDGGGVTENMFELVAHCERMLNELSEINPLLSIYLRSLKDEAVARNMLSIMMKGTTGR
jgi:hypothetical protein